MRMDRLFTPEDEGKVRARMALARLLKEVAEQNRGSLPSIASVELEPLVRRACEVTARLDGNSELSDEERENLHAEYWNLAASIERLEPTWRAEQREAVEEFDAGLRPSAYGSTVIRPERNTLQ